MADRKIRKDADLAKGGVKDKLILLTRKAAQLSKKNNYSGVESLSKAKFPNGVLYRVTGKKGVIIGLADDGQALKDIKSAANKAVNDVAEQKYTESVKAFLNEVTSAVGVRSAGGMNTTMLKGMTF